MDLYEGILTRRSVRQFDTSKTLSKQDLEEIIKAAQYAPSAHNKQPWSFLVITDKTVMADLRKIQPWTSFAKDAAAVVLVIVCSLMLNFGVPAHYTTLVS